MQDLSELTQQLQVQNESFRRMQRANADLQVGHLSCNYMQCIAMAPESFMCLDIRNRDLNRACKYCIVYTCVLLTLAISGLGYTIPRAAG